MEYKNFLDVLVKIHSYDEKIGNINAMGIGLCDLGDPLYSAIHLLLREIYNEEGVDWIYWFIYENNMGKKGVAAWNAKERPICYNTKSLHKYIEKHCKNTGT